MITYCNIRRLLHCNMCGNNDEDTKKAEKDKVLVMEQIIAPYTSKPEENKAGAKEKT